MPLNAKQMAVVAAISLAISAGVVYLSNNNDTFEDVIG